MLGFIHKHLTLFSLYVLQNNSGKTRKKNHLGFCFFIICELAGVLVGGVCIRPSLLSAVPVDVTWKTQKLLSGKKKEGWSQLTSMRGYESIYCQSVTTLNSLLQKQRYTQKSKGISTQWVSGVEWVSTKKKETLILSLKWCVQSCRKPQKEIKNQSKDKCSLGSKQDQIQSLQQFTTSDGWNEGQHLHLRSN